MKHLNTLLLSTVMGAALVGCGGGGSSSSSDLPDVSVNPDLSSCDESVSPRVCTLKGTIVTDKTLDAETEWRLDGVVKIGQGDVRISSDAQVDAIKAAGVTLTVEEGVHVKAFNNGVLIVTRGSKMEAEGSAVEPITFSSVSDEDFDGEGEWGGVVIQGFAPQWSSFEDGNVVCSDVESGDFCNVAGEGGDDVAFYGGVDADDDSGTIRYVRIAEAGKVAGPDNEVNGLTLQGVGHETTVEYVQVHGNLDDGVEWFGGTVDARYLVLTNNDDDDIDFDEGYQGNIQYAIVRKNNDKEAPTGKNDPRGIEANSSDEGGVPQTEAVLANISIIGGAVNNSTTSEAGQQPGMRLRGALNVQIHNTVVTDFDNGCIRIDDADRDGNDTTTDDTEFSKVTLNNVIGDCERYFRPNDEGSDEKSFLGLGESLDIDVDFNGNWAITNTEAQLGSATTITAVANGGSFTFDQTDYVGAVDPDATTAWWDGWIIEGTLDQDVILELAE